MKEDLLIVVDMQHDFVDMALENSAAKAIVTPLAEFIKKWNGNIIATLDTHKGPDSDERTNIILGKNYLEYSKSQEGKMLPVPHCLFGTKGHELVEDIQNACVEVVNNSIGHVYYKLNKPTFGFTEWKDVIQRNGFDPKRIVLTGTCTDICVISNALILKALYPETEIYVLEDLCAGLTEEKHNAAIKVMDSCQIKVIKSGDFVL